MHSSEIVAHEFPRANDGLQPAAVASWLAAVAASVADLEDELTHSQDQRQQTSASLRRLRRRPASAQIRAALMQTRLRRRTRGYDRHQVEQLLEAAAAELARLESEVALLNTELEADPPPPLRRAFAERVLGFERDSESDPATADWPGLHQGAL